MAGVEDENKTNRRHPDDESAVPLAGNWQFSKTQSCSGLVHSLKIEPNQWTDRIKREEPEQPLLVELNELRKMGESIILEKRKRKTPKIMRRYPNKKRI